MALTRAASHELASLLKLATARPPLKSPQPTWCTIRAVWAQGPVSGSLSGLRRWNKLEQPWLPSNPESQCFPRAAASWTFPRVLLFAHLMSRL